MTPVALARERTSPSIDGALERSPGPIDIVLAYHQAVMRSGLRMLLDSVRDFKVVAEAEDAEDARRYVRGHHPRVLILDLDLDKPGCSIIAAMVLMRAEAPGTGIVVLGLHQDVTVVRDVMAAGALGYLPTSATADDLKEAVRRVGSGGTYMSPSVLAAVAKLSEPGPTELTAREAEVIGLIALGFTSAEVAEQLFLSVRTIEAHRARIQMKLGRPTRAELVAYAIEHGMTGHRSPFSSRVSSLGRSFTAPRDMVPIDRAVQIKRP